MHAAAQRSDRTPRGYWALWNKLAAIAAEPRNHALHWRIVETAVDLRDRDPVRDAGEHADLPICNMAGEDDHPPPGRECPIDMLEAVRLDASAWLEDADFS